MGIDGAVLTKGCQALADFFEDNFSLDCRPALSDRFSCGLICADKSSQNEYSIKVADTYSPAEVDLNCFLRSDVLTCSARNNDFHLFFSFDGSKVTPVSGHIASSLDSICERNAMLFDMLSSLELFWIPSSW